MADRARRRLQSAGHCVHAERGRLLELVRAWDESVAWTLVRECADRVRDIAASALREQGFGDAAADLAGCDDLRVLRRVAGTVAAAAHGRASLLAGFAEDVAHYSLETTHAAAAASVGSFVAAHALAGGDMAGPDYEPRFEAERRRQAAWLKERLALGM